MDTIEAFFGKLADFLWGDWLLFALVGLVWSVQDVALGLLIIPNILALICMGTRVRQTIKEFLNPQNGYVGSEERVK